MGLPPQLEADLVQLQEEGYSVSAQRIPPGGNQVFVVFEKYPLPKGWNRSETRLLVITDISYPNSKLDMFWVEPGLRLDGGRNPQAGEAIESYIGQQWQRFSWHVQKWNPAFDNIKTYLGTIDKRLKDLK